jgi:alkanesulfonate monooxygenase SsuD/methylene tetrahydromethanopterin reductase-like flavin-dependent oxidoreductase (luciferase family)
MKKKMDKACKAEGRDPQTLRYSYMVSLALPDLSGWDKDKKRGYLVGTPQELALALKEYEARGASELMFHLIPSSPEGYERLARAVEIYRSMGTSK